MEHNLPHLFLTQEPEVKSFSSMGSVVKSKKIFKNNKLHGNKIYKNIASVLENKVLESLPNDYIKYITIEGRKDLLAVLASLEDGHKNVNVKISTIKCEQCERYKVALCVNKNYLTNFFRKLHGYINETTQKGIPKNRDLMNEIDKISTLFIKDLWIGEENLLPHENLKKWCEVWILESNPTRFFSICDELKIKYNKKSIIKFVERTVINVEISLNDMKNLILKYPLLGEFRPKNALASFWSEMHRNEQNEWVQNLVARTHIIKNPNTIISILDTGVNNGHPLLKLCISDDDCDTCNMEWGKNDIDGHGSEMCGIAIYGDIQDCLLKNSNIEISHGVFSIKVLPHDGYKDEEGSYCLITREAVARENINYPRKNIINCLAVTEEELQANIDGLPSSWSATLDMLSSGQNVDSPDAEKIEDKKLFVVSGGNIDDTRMNYPEDNKYTPIQSPSQAWNVLTVGAYTEKADSINGKSVLAKKGGLSPYSRTSYAWKNSTCPIKPEILFEGGNKVLDISHSYQSPDHSILTTSSNVMERAFDLTSGTSPATAQAAHFAAKLQVEYPNFWAETIRGLMVHSAQWTDEMKKQFLPKKQSKNGYENILRICGYGIPNLEYALHSAQNSLVLIAQNTIQPYQKEGDTIKTKEMHLYELPWDTESLLRLGETKVEMKVTLSYFIEPAPFSMGKIQNNKYRYASYGLRFDINRPNEKKDFFVKKINKIDNDAAKKNGEILEGRENSKWVYGENTGIYNGSLHSNVWVGTAAELATSNLLAVYPVMGWWKDRKSLNRYNKMARYSLIISITTPEVETDIYTPILNKIKVSVRNQIVL